MSFAVALGLEPAEDGARVRFGRAEGPAAREARPDSDLEAIDLPSPGGAPLPANADAAHLRAFADRLAEARIDGRSLVDVARSADPAGLVAFGAFGDPAFACRLADALGIDRVLLRPRASLRHAAGADLAALRVALSQPVGAPLSPAVRLQAAADLDRLSVVAMAEVHAQGAAEAEIGLAPTLLLRAADADDDLPIRFGTERDMRAAYALARGAPVDQGAGAGAPLHVAALRNAAEAPAPTPLPRSSPFPVAGSPAGWTGRGATQGAVLLTRG